MGMRRAVHFVRFERFDQHYWNAVAAFGPPDFLHRYWDRRARREIDESDLIVFAKGSYDQPHSAFNGDDEWYMHFKEEI
jgi:hypothetical protein